MTKPRKVHLGSLTVGRCFYREPPPPPDGAEWENAPSRLGSPIAHPSNLFRVDAPGESVSVTSAAGETTSLPADLLVVEVPRAGFDRAKALST